jgi:hypothetical protein
MFEIIRKEDQTSLDTLEAAAHGVLDGGHNISDRNEYDNRIVELGLEMYLNSNKIKEDVDQLKREMWKFAIRFLVTTGALGGALIYISKLLSQPH